MWQASFCWLTSLYAGNLAGARAQGSPFPPVILRSAATKNPGNRTPCVAIRDPSLTLRMTAVFCEVYGILR